MHECELCILHSQKIPGDFLSPQALLKPSICWESSFGFLWIFLWHFLKIHTSQNPWQHSTRNPASNCISVHTCWRAVVVTCGVKPWNRFQRQETIFFGEVQIASVFPGLKTFLTKGPTDQLKHRLLQNTLITTAPTTKSSLESCCTHPW